jgi:PTH1 family peptidyl-tRNA hydrolase
VQRIILGLGNPGNRYQDTRHNVGFWFIDHLAHHWDFPLFHVVENVLLSEGRVRGKRILLAKPSTYMNRSGLALVTLSRVIAFDPSDLLVCHDDLDIPVGRFKLKPSGGAGGHKGVISVLRFIGGEEVPRLKFGILPERKPRDVERFVLSSFEEDEEICVVDLFPCAREAVECLLREGIEKAMSLYNRRDSEPFDPEV